MTDITNMDDTETRAMVAIANKILPILHALPPAEALNATVFVL